MGNFDDYFYLGKIIKPHGFQGRLSIFLDTDDPDEYLDIKVVFLNINGAPVPYFVNELSILNNKAIIAFADVENQEQAEKLIKKDIYLPLKQLPPLTGNQFYYHEIIGMMLIDKEFGMIGPVSEVLEYSNQAIIQTFHKNKEVLIPISDDIIEKVDRENETIHLLLPEGLIEVYLEA
jgi:16S rRNA processing protein RimM